MHSCWNCYLSMYFTLNYVWDGLAKPGNGLSEYLSDANPFLFKGRGSADPAIWLEFERDFLTRFPSGSALDEESLEFVRAYLAEKGPYYMKVFPGGDEVPFLNLFDAETDLAEWTRMLDDLERQEQEMNK